MIFTFNKYSFSFLNFIQANTPEWYLLQTPSYGSPERRLLDYSYKQNIA